MLKKTLLPVTLALTVLTGLAPAFASMTLPYQTPPGTPETPSALSEAALDQMAAEAGITFEQARHLTISQLAALKEARDS